MRHCCMYIQERLINAYLYMPSIILLHCKLSGNLASRAPMSFCSTVRPDWSIRTSWAIISLAYTGVWYTPSWYAVQQYCCTWCRGTAHEYISCVHAIYQTLQAIRYPSLAGAHVVLLYMRPDTSIKTSDSLLRSTYAAAWFTPS